MTKSDTTIPVRSPWGRVQYGDALTDGIVSVSTSGHGGIRISEARLAAMPAALRVGNTRWFEEDCEASLVLWAFARDLNLTAEQTAMAEESVRHWFPAKWERHSGATLRHGQSITRDAETSARQTADKFVVTCAYGDWHEKVPVGWVGCTARRGSDGVEAHYLVAADRYELRGRDYVIDPAVDIIWKAFAE